MREELLTLDGAREELGVDEAEFEELVTAGTLRRVDYAGERFILTADVERERAERDPRELAKRVPRI